MKRAFAAIMALMLMIPGLSASAADSAEVFVTISDAAGTLVLAQEKITVTDADEDGALTINDALSAAHEAKYEGGAAAGYACAETAYGLSMTMLWGCDAGSYGYYLNDASAWSLADPVVDGDRVAAFVYTDQTGWSDTYSFFDTSAASAEAGTAIPLTLLAAGFDADWNPVTVPVEGAVITVDGEATDVTTDAAGKAAVVLDKAGTYVISATSEAQRLVPAACIVTVSSAAAAEGGGVSYLALCAALLVMAIIGVVVRMGQRRK